VGAGRSVLSEGAGVPIPLAHDGANRNDQKLLEPTLQIIPIERPEPKAPGWRARRWVVEACHSWLNRNRLRQTQDGS
jgi:hypothetical protein